MDNYCEIGKYIMELFSKYVDVLNQEASDKLDYTARKTFKPMKANQATLAKLLDKPTSNISYIIIGKTALSQEMLLKITDKLDLCGSEFQHLVHLFAIQNIVTPLGLLPENMKYDTTNIANKLNETHINLITAQLLYEIISAKCKEYYERYHDFPKTSLDQIKKLDTLTSYNLTKLCNEVLK